MNRLIAFLSLALLACPLLAGDPPNTLRPWEIAAGWLLLFDGETTFGWHNADASRWVIKDGAITAKGAGNTPLINTVVFKDYQLTVDYQLKEGQSGMVLLGTDPNGKDCPKKNIVKLEPTKGAWYRLVAEVRDSSVEYAEAKPGEWGIVGVPIGPRPAPSPPGHIAIVGDGVVVRSIKILPRDLKSLFNGKDLTGWKEHPNKKSVFTVKDGAITVKNGPGDLQSEAQWADFVLQLECISNGKHLNSGVFFRCRPNEYQQGYEAQIHNGFGEQPKDYIIEEYDPKTNELKDKKKMQATALDYGTGAIYRRMPARKQMAKDGEWFTMTVVAQGRHFATWVNGVQVVDWTDNRPLKDNVRNGCMLEKGNISFQGHDPTTDLSFRNIRIAELPAGKK